MTELTLRPQDEAIKITLITVVLNGEKYIEEAFNSVAKQQYDDLEYIVIDGGSTDRTLDIVKKYEWLIAKVISEPDDGLYFGLNKGLLHATGHVVGILHSDDWLEEDALNTIADKYRISDGATVLYGACRYWASDNAVAAVLLYGHQYLSRQMISHPAVFVPKILYERYGVFDTRYKIAADYDFMLRLFNSGINFLVIEKILANFRAGGLSARNPGVFEALKIRKKFKKLSFLGFALRAVVNLLTSRLSGL